MKSDQENIPESACRATSGMAVAPPAQCAGTVANQSFTSARIVLAISVACVSSGAIFARLAHCPALAIAAWRMTFATALISLALVRWWPELRALKRRDLAIGGTAGLCLAIHFATWISSLDYTTVASSTVLVNTIPLWVALFSPLVTRERASRRAWVGISVSFVGSAFMAGSDFHVGGSALLGDVLALAGGLSAAFYLLLGRQLRIRLSLPTYCILTYGAATAVLWVIVFAANVPASGFNAKSWSAIAAMAVISQIGGHTLYNWSLKHLSTAAVAVALLGEPIGSALLAWKIFGEIPAPASIGGGLIVLLGIFLASSGGPARRSDAEASAPVPPG